MEPRAADSPFSPRGSACQTRCAAQQVSAIARVVRNRTERGVRQAVTMLSAKGSLVAMNRLGIRLFAARLRERPLAALASLLRDYLTYVGMVLFWLFLLASKRPLAWLDSGLRRPLRPRLVEWVARRARG